MTKSKKIVSSGKWKGIRNQRQGEIYRWVKKELYKKEVLPTVDWVTRTPTLQEQETYASQHYQSWKTTKDQRNYILKETAHLYREEQETKRGQILWYQEQAGFTRVNPKRIVKKQKLKGIFYQI